MNKKKKRKRKIRDYAPEFWQKYGPMVSRVVTLYNMVIEISKHGENEIINRHILKNLKDGSQKIEEAIDCLSAVLIELQPEM